MSPQGPEKPQRALNAIAAQRIYSRVLYLVTPAAVAGAITWIRTERFATGLLMTATVALSAAAMRMQRFPLHLVRVAQVLSGVLVPLAGAALAYAVARIEQAPLSIETALDAGAGAAAITLAAQWLERRFAADSPVRVAVIGPGGFTRRFAAELAENGIRAYEVVGYIDAEADALTDQPRLGALAEVRAIVTGHRIDLLLIGADERRLEVFETTAKACLDLPVRMIEATALYEEVLGHVPLGTINSAWFQFIMHPRYSPASPITKRGLDVVLAGAMVLFTLPLLALCALAVKLEDRGPIFYRQRRVGEEGREFDILKLRTLVPDADERLAAGADDEAIVTRVGAALRKLHLNELPQLWQAVKGDISLVGPRPELPETVDALSGLVPHYDRRALVKPGLTGWAQVRCGYAGSHYGTAWKHCYDLYYIKHRSARFDLVILLQTLHALVEREESEEVLPQREFVLGDAAPELVRH